MICPLPMPVKRKQPEWKHNHRSKQNRKPRQFQCSRQRITHQIRNGNAIGNRVAEITRENTAQPVHILNDERLIEPQLRAELRNELRIGGNAHHDKV